MIRNDLKECIVQSRNGLIEDNWMHIVRIVDRVEKVTRTRTKLRETWTVS